MNKFFIHAKNISMPPKRKQTEEKVSTGKKVKASKVQIVSTPLTLEPDADTVELLEQVSEFLTRVKDTNKTNEKISILKEYTHLRPLLEIIYNPLLTSGVTANGIKKATVKVKNNPFNFAQYNQVLPLLKALCQRQLTGHAALAAIHACLGLYPEFEKVLISIFDMDLETRMGLTTANKAFDPILCHEFEVALGQDWEKGQSHFEEKDDQPWFISRKYDGVRVITILKPEGITCHSREGKMFTSLEKLQNDLQILLPHLNEPMVLDGEMCVVDNNGHENFKQAVSQIKKQSLQMEQYRYYVFDWLTLADFQKGTSDSVLSERLRQLEHVLATFPVPQVSLIEMVPYTPENFGEWNKKVEDNNWEGLMLRLDASYKWKRSFDILKVKQFFTEEYKVKNIKTGPFRLIDAQTGLEKTIETMTAVEIEHKGHLVSVGSGFSQAQRQEFYKNPNLIVDQVIAVQYFEETMDKNGKLSLRFPTFKHLYGIERNV